MAGRLCAKFDFETLSRKVSGERGGLMHALEQFGREDLEQVGDCVAYFDDAIPGRRAVRSEAHERDASWPEMGLELTVLFRTE